ncbi:MAG: DUF3299 domain-containing protein [Planctomycetota bacterium]|nr:DUF3299 domain-containing protein [Planctomycetota bacterium]
MSSHMALERLSLESSEADYAKYRSLSGLVVMGLVFAVFGLSALLTPWLAVLPILGSIFSLRGLSAVRRNSEELTGYGLAVSGLFLNLVVLVSSISLHSYVYATEVPEGFLRVNYSELQLATNAAGTVPGLPVPQRALELHDKNIFIKGYVYPDGRQSGIQHFILVPDLGTCCFGGDPALTDMIEVKLKEPLEIEYSYARRKLAGTFRVNPQPNGFMGKTAVYQLDAEYVR